MANTLQSYKLKVHYINRRRRTNFQQDLTARHILLKFLLNITDVQNLTYAYIIMQWSKNIFDLCTLIISSSSLRPTQESVRVLAI
jgi:hypothetical protein